MFRSLVKKFLSKPWREPYEWNEEMFDTLLKEVGSISYKGDVQKAGILICGPNQSGKSSFINTVMSICKGRQANVTQAMSSKTSVTYQCVRKSSCGSLGNFNITDTTGLLEPHGRGLNIQDVIFSLQGKIKDGYQFTDTPIAKDSDFFNDSQTKEDELHCLVIVLDVNLLDKLSEKYLNKLKEIIDATLKIRYPMVLVLTKLDTICPYLREDITHMFKSMKVKKAVQKASELLGFQEKDIHPVINYTDELTTNKIKSIPILIALRYILYVCADKLQH